MSWHTTDHSITVPLEERKLCYTCGHLHRAALAKKCGCCREDIQDNTQD